MKVNLYMVDMNPSQSAYSGPEQYLIGLRQEFDFSPVFVSTKTGISRSRYGKLERDLTGATIGELAKIQKLYDDNNKLTDSRPVDIFEMYTKGPLAFNAADLYFYAGRVHTLVLGSQHLLNDTRHHYLDALHKVTTEEFYKKSKESSANGIPFEERVANVLVEGGFITDQQRDQAKKISGDTGSGLLDVLVSSGMLAQETLVTVLSFQLRIPVVDLRHVEVDPEAVKLVPEEYARQYGVMPTGFDTDGSLRVATRMPNDFQLAAELSTVTGRNTKFVLAIGGRIEDMIDKVYAGVDQRLIIQTSNSSQKVEVPPQSIEDILANPPFK